MIERKFWRPGVSSTCRFPDVTVRQLTKKNFLVGTGAQMGDKIALLGDPLG